MNRTVVLLLILGLVAFFAAGCGEGPVNDAPPVEPEENAAEEVAETPVDPGDMTSFGLGVVTSIGRSVDADPGAGIEAMAQVDDVIAVAAFDSEGRVVDVIIDTAQTRVNFDQEMQVASDLDAPIKTKRELGDDYGMRAASPIEREWDEQIADLEAWMIGKTVAEVFAMEMDEGGYPQDPDVVTSVTMRVSSYVAALDKAYTNRVPLEGGAVRLGLGHNVSINRSIGYSNGDVEVLPMAQVDVVIAGAVFKASGEVAGVLIDTSQTRVNFDSEGRVSSDRDGEYLTKRELGDDYGMRAASPIEREWDEQIADLEAWMIGKTVAEIFELERDEGGYPEDADLVTTVTMRVNSYFAALEEAYSRSR